MSVNRKRGRSPMSETEHKPESARPRTEIIEELTFQEGIKYFAAFIDCAIVCNELVKTANSLNDLLILGFDMEWTFNFNIHHSDTAVLQICSSLDLCYLFHIIECKNLPKSLCDLLTHPKVRIVGDNVENNIRKLSKEFPCLDADLVLPNCVDIAEFANETLDQRKKWTMDKLAINFLNMKMTYNKKMRLSDWHSVPLSKSQQNYAALNAYAPLLIYHQIKKISLMEHEQNVDNNNENNNNNTV